VFMRNWLLFTRRSTTWQGRERVTVVEKPWGREVWWAQTESYVGKFLEVKAGHRLSLQYHREKLETMYCLKGTGILLLDGEEIELTPGVTRTIRPGQVHRLVAIEDLTMVEVSTPQVEDVIRLEDSYGRQTGS
jgi:quercetin dioxygenase-like cupin family protein